MAKRHWSYYANRHTTIALSLAAVMLLLGLMAMFHWLNEWQPLTPVESELTTP